MQAKETIKITAQFNDIEKNDTNAISRKKSKLTSFSKTDKEKKEEIQLPILEINKRYHYKDQRDNKGILQTTLPK